MAILKIALRELKAMKKEKTLLVVILFFLFVSSFSSVLTFGFASIYSPAEDTKIGLVGNASIFETVVNPVCYGSFDAALHDFHSGKLDIIVLLEENTSTQNIMTIFLPAEEIRAIKVSTALKEKLIQYQNRLRAKRGIHVPELKMYLNGQEVKITNVHPLYFRFVYIMLIPILAIVSAVLPASTLIDSLTEEFETRTIDVLLSVVKLRDIIIGKVLVVIFMSLFLVSSWIALLSLNGIAIYNAFLVLIICTSISLFFISLALLSALSRDRERAQLIFSLSSASLIILSFSFPLSFMNLLSRVSANSCFAATEILAYFICSSSVLCFLVFVSIRELGRG